MHMHVNKLDYLVVRDSQLPETDLHRNQQKTKIFDILLWRKSIERINKY